MGVVPDLLKEFLGSRIVCSVDIKICTPLGRGGHFLIMCDSY